MGMIKHSRSTQSNEFAIPLQYLKKEVRNRVFFLHADNYQSFYKLVLLFLHEVARHVESTENRKSIIFLQYIKKKVSQLLLCSIAMQNIQISYGGPVMFVITCFWGVVVKNEWSLLDRGALKAAMYISKLN